MDTRNVSSNDEWHCAVQKPKEAGGKPVSDQWIPPFVIVDDDGQAVGTIQASGPTKNGCMPLMHACLFAFCIHGQDRLQQRCRSTWCVGVRLLTEKVAAV